MNLSGVVDICVGSVTIDPNCSQVWLECTMSKDDLVELCSSAYDSAIEAAARYTVWRYKHDSGLDEVRPQTFPMLRQVASIAFASLDEQKRHVERVFTTHLNANRSAVMLPPFDIDVTVDSGCDANTQETQIVVRRIPYILADCVDTAADEIREYVCSNEFQTHKRSCAYAMHVDAEDFSDDEDIKTHYEAKMKQLLGNAARKKRARVVVDTFSLDRTVTYSDGRVEQGTQTLVKFTVEAI